MEKKQILIIDNSELSYTGDDINGFVLRGTETSLILLSEALAKKNIDVFFATKTNLYADDFILKKRSNLCNQ